MKKILWFFVAYQVYLVTYPCGNGMESLLAARAITHGMVPYRDFMIHVGPLGAYLFAGLFSVPIEVWVALVFIGFNLLSTWGLYKLSLKHYDKTTSLAVCCLYLLIVPMAYGNMQFPETMVTTFGVWGIYFWGEKKRVLAWLFFVLAVLTKQTGGIFPIAALLGDI